MAYGPGQGYPPLPAGPGGSGPLVPAVNPAWLAASADRERAVSVLRAGFAEGRLSQDELDDRVARVYAARTYGQLWALTEDLPAGPLPYPQGPVAVMPHSSAPDSHWRAATTLLLTALVIFTLAALITALITVHTQAVFYPTNLQPGVHLMPYITSQPGP